MNDASAFSGPRTTTPSPFYANFDADEFRDVHNLFAMPPPSVGVKNVVDALVDGRWKDYVDVVSSTTESFRRELIVSMEDRFDESSKDVDLVLGALRVGVDPNVAVPTPGAVFFDVPWIWDHLGNKRVLEEALRRGLDLKRRDFRGRTPLHATCESADGDVVKRVEILIAAGADPSVVDDTGRTFVDVFARAKICGAPNVAEVLAKVEKERGKKRTEKTSELFRVYSSFRTGGEKKSTR